MVARQDVVSCCNIQDKATNARTDFQSQVEVENLAKAADELLRLVSELKIAIIVQEVKEGNTEMRQVYDQETRQSLHDLGELRGNVANALGALEKHYYASTTRWSNKTPE